MNFSDNKFPEIHCRKLPVLPALAQDRKDSTYVFRFVPTDDMFYVPLGDNGAELCGLFGILHYLCPNVAKEGMEIIFNEKYLQEMYLTGQTDKKHRYQPQVVRKYIRVIDIMIDAPDVQGLLRYNSLNYEKPKGDKAGLSSVRVNDQYRIEFEEQVREDETIATICNITDLSNHYK